MTQHSFIIGKLYQTAVPHPETVFDRAQKEDNEWVDSGGEGLLLTKGTPGLIIAIPDPFWAIALVEDQTVWLYLDDCEPL